MEKTKEIAISTLNIKIGGREIALTIEEAKKLKMALEDLFGREVIKVIENRWYYDTNKIYLSPPQPYFPPRPYEIWCGGTAGDPEKFLATQTSNKVDMGDQSSNEVLFMDVKC